MTAPPVLEFEGGSALRHLIVCSLLSRKAIRVFHINADSDAPGLRDYEVNFLKFIDRCTAGSKFEVRDGQTELIFRPGLILGGTFSHAVPCSRSVTYLVEAALLLLPFAKTASEITLTGSTQHDADLSPDTVRTVSLRWLKLFGVEALLRIVRRGAGTEGGGCVVLTCESIRRLRAATVTDRGRIKRIRGIAFSSNASTEMTKQCATSSKGLMLNFLPDVYVITDCYAAPPGHHVAGTSGYGMMLVAESTSDTCLLSQETVAHVGELPEDVGRRTAELLLDEIAAGGCVDQHHQLLLILLMAIAPEDVSTVRFGALSPSGITALVLVETFFGVSCAMKEEPPAEGAGAGVPSAVVVSCIGANVINVSKKSS